MLTCHAPISRDLSSDTGIKPSTFYQVNLNMY